MFSIHFIYYRLHKLRKKENCWDKILELKNKCSHMLACLGHISALFRTTSKKKKRCCDLHERKVKNCKRLSLPIKIEKTIHSLETIVKVCCSLFKSHFFYRNRWDGDDLGCGNALRPISLPKKRLVAEEGNDALRITKHQYIKPLAPLLSTSGMWHALRDRLVWTCISDILCRRSMVISMALKCTYSRRLHYGRRRRLVEMRI